MKPPQERLGELVAERLQIENAFQTADNEQNARRQQHAEIVGAIKAYEEIISGAEQEEIANCEIGTTD